MKITKFKVLEHLRLLYYRLKDGTPPVSRFTINGELIKKCVNRDNPVFLEIGSNNGAHALWFNDLFANPSIYCFEPDPRAIKNFKHRVGNRANIKLFPFALSEKNGCIDFYQSSGQRENVPSQEMSVEWDLSGSIRKPKNHLILHPWVKFENIIPIKTMTLDKWFEEQGLDLIDFIWMDVQGAEMDVVQGAKATLAKTRFVYTEYNNGELYEGQPTLKHLLKSLKDFQVLVRYPNDVLLWNRRIHKKLPTEIARLCSL